MKSFRLCACLVGWLLLSLGATAAEEVTLESLLKEMTDRSTLAKFPLPAYTCSQASSYDRNSDDPNNKKTWFANADRSQWVRIEENEVDGEKRREFVMMDEAGPGAIVRFWGTWHGPRGEKFSNGTLRIYLDGSDTPAIEGPIQEVLDQGMLAGAPLSQGVSPSTPYGQRGHNLYLPIPYAQHCKVTYETDVYMDIGAQRGEALYYQINYRTYAPGTEVESFTMDGLKEAKPAIEKTQAALLSAYDPQSSSFAAAEHLLRKGDTAEVKREGSQAIEQITLKVDAEDIDQALRSTVMKIEFDGEKCVWVPVGEFFGIGYQPAEYKSFYTEQRSDGTLVANWVMPFEKSAKVALENLDDQSVKVDLKVKSSPWQWDDRSMHFHAVWQELYKVDSFVGSDRPGDAAYDVNYVTVDGKGVYVGDTLTIFNGAAAWWGEGDEKIYVDGESFPSHIGTGTEDYYGYAWCRPENFSAPFHAQPTGDGNLIGGFSVNSRYRGLDAIPFTKSIQFDMELWHWKSTKVNYAPTAFFYARPGATANVEPDTEAAARAVTRSRGEMGTIFVVEGVTEGENLKIVSKTGGSTQQQHHGDWGWSNEQQLWWRDTNVGDELVVEFPAKTAGRYEVIANLTQASDYGKVEVLVNDQPAKTIDSYAEGVSSREVSLGEFDLLEGANRLTIRLVGHNDKAITRGMFGLDYLKLEEK
ncbi:glycoside hydrolase family 172 protein [Aeoliella sp.]|uniref:glycoside hydrolase family 172 protein n=1 Tax=Aeoliella sp. TaxID=2795800 RepID=UPI003CCBA42F